MTPVALDGTKLLILMLAGGVFAAAGIWLMFRPQAGGEAAKIEVFGLKFQSSSAGLLVFLIGAAFLAVPIFVPEKAVQLASASEATSTVRPPTDESSDEGEGSSKDPPPQAPHPDSAIGKPGQQFVVHAEEREPNDSHGSANILVPGTAVAGRIKFGDRDHFCIDIPPGVTGTLVVTLRTRLPSLELVDDVGMPLTSAEEEYQTTTTTVAAQAPIERSRYCVVAATNDRFTPDQEHPYHFSAAVRSD